MPSALYLLNHTDVTHVAVSTKRCRMDLSYAVNPGMYQHILTKRKQDDNEMAMYKHRNMLGSCVLTCCQLIFYFTLLTLPNSTSVGLDRVAHQSANIEHCAKVTNPPFVEYV